MIGRNTVVAVVLCVCVAGLLSLPALVRSPSDPPAEGRRLIIITPHTEQIRYEFGRAFSRWHERNYGQPAAIEWRTPGGTSEIRRLLISQYRAALLAGDFTIDDRGHAAIAPGRVGYDVLFGGGSYEHGQVKRGVTVRAPAGVAGVDEGQELTVPISVPVRMDDAALEAIFGDNRIGSQRLYDPERYWIGTALSSFGIVYNKDRYRKANLPPPQRFEDLTHRALADAVSLADPRQSGSITTTMDSILNVAGWERGWAILREMAANARTFSSAATQPPLDVAAGEAMAGLAIDFYGRSQAQAVVPPGQPPSASRVGYVDPAGAVYIDADPVSILRGGPDREMAERFVRFTLTEQAQVLWQFPTNPDRAGPAPKGPARYALRRAPVLRSVYRDHAHRFIDTLDPFSAAADVDSRGWRSAIGMLFGAFGVDSDEELRRAWQALWRLRDRAAADPDNPTLAAALADAERAFYAMPTQSIPDGKGGQRVVPIDAEHYRAVREVWRDPGAAADARIAYTRFFRDRYREVVRLERSTR